MNTADISKFINIDSKNMKGWFYPADMISFWMLNEIQKALNMTGSVCEVGVFEGKSLASGRLAGGSRISKKTG